jgi:hypothetical protein
MTRPGTLLKSRELRVNKVSPPTASNCRNPQIHGRDSQTLSEQVIEDGRGSRVKRQNGRRCKCGQDPVKDFVTADDIGRRLRLRYVRITTERLLVETDDREDQIGVRDLSEPCQ